LGLELRVVVYSGCDGVTVQSRGLGHFLAGFEVDGVASAFACRNRRYAECVDVVLCLELRVVVNSRCDGVAVQGGRFGHLLAGCKRNWVTIAFALRNWVDRESALFLPLDCRRSLGGSFRKGAGSLHFVFGRQSAGKSGGAWKRSVEVSQEAH
jgi:hypothetical protein